MEQIRRLATARPDLFLVAILIPKLRATTQMAHNFTNLSSARSTLPLKYKEQIPSINSGSSRMD